MHTTNMDNSLHLQESKSGCSSYMSFTKYLSLSHRHEGLMFDNNYIYLSIQSVCSFHSLHHIAQVGIADVLEVGLVVDVEELQFIGHDTNADDDPGTTALATTL